MKFCKYGCNDNGKYFDKITRTFKICPDHKKIRSGEVREGVTEDGLEVYKLLGFSGDYLTYEFDESVIISKSQIAFLDSSSVEETQRGVRELVDNLTLGVPPKISITISLDRQFNADSIAVPLLLNAYKAGLSVAPLISATDYRIKVQREDNENTKRGTAETFRDVYLDRKVVLMIIPSGVSEYDVLEAKGLMQARAVKGNSTIFLTSKPKELLSEICALDAEEATKYSSLFIGVRYKGYNHNEKVASAYKNNNRNPNSVSLSGLKNLTAL